MKSTNSRPLNNRRSSRPAWIAAAFVTSVIGMMVLSAIVWASSPGAQAQAPIPDANGVIHACYERLTGTVRLIDPASAQCLPTETAISWNQTGPQSPPGSGDGCVNVKDVGAKGDGTTDDTTAIQAALAAQPCVAVPPGNYRIDGILTVLNQLTLSPGAHLIRKSQFSSSTAPVVLLSNNYATLVGGGWVESENNSPRGIICVGPPALTTVRNINWARIDGIKIKGVSTDSDNVGLNLDSSEPPSPAGAGGGSTYNGSFSNLVIREVAVGVKINPICNAHTFNSIFFYTLTRYSYWSIGNSENSYFGGFTHLSHGVTVIKLEGVGYNLFYGVQAEPGPGSRYFDVDQSSVVCQIIGHNNCFEAPINNSASLTYLSHGILSLVNLEATKHEPRWFLDPYKPVPVQADAQANSSAASVDQLKADFNALLDKLRTSGAIKP